MQHADEPVLRPGGGLVAVPAPAELVRLRLDLGYDGTGFAGWAVQPGLRTVQGEVELALGRVLRLPGAPRTACAGRTDTGVHARGQVAHSDVPAAAWAAVSARGGQFVLRRLHGALPPDVRVTALGPAPDGFDARWSARSRSYSYRVSDGPAGPDPLLRSWVLHHRGDHGAPLDLEAMNHAAQGLLGEHDFAAYCKRRDGGSTVRTLHRLHWSRPADGPDAGLAVLRVRADAFCHSMVRMLVGSLLAVGAGRTPREHPGEVLARRSRDPDGPTAPARGLCLEQVDYPPDAELAAAAAGARRFRGAESEIRYR